MRRKRPAGLRDVGGPARAETRALLEMLDSTSAMGRAELRGVSDEELRWQATKGGHSIGMILLHIADVEYWWVQVVALGWPQDQALHDKLLSRETNQYAGAWPKPPVRRKAWFLKQCDEVRAVTKRELVGLDASKHKGRIGEREYSLRWILHHLIEHEAYHLGQAVLLRELYKKKGART